MKEAGSAVKTGPNPQRDVLMGLALGLLLGFGLAFLIEALDTRVRTGDEIAERLGLPLLGRIPEPPKSVRSHDGLVMLDEPGSPRSEVFRVLRTNIEFADLEHQVRTLMVTSAVESEGKSTTVANLAVAMARAGKRVCLVDLDLRRPYVANFFGLVGAAGLTDVALGHIALDRALHGIAVTEGGPLPAGAPGHRRPTRSSMCCPPALCRRTLASSSSRRRSRRSCTTCAIGTTSCSSMRRRCCRSAIRWRSRAGSTPSC